jgi:hypothetical protein
MMAFSHSKYTDASGSNFYDAGRDHLTLNINQTIHISITPLTSEQTCHNLLRNFNNGPPVSSGPKTLSQIMRFAPIYHSEADIAARLIVQIVQSLMDSGTSDPYRDLKLELKLSQQTLALTGHAIQTYEYTPLGRALASTVNQEAEGCRMVLQELLNKINDYQ